METPAQVQHHAIKFTTLAWTTRPARAGGHSVPLSRKESCASHLPKPTRCRQVSSSTQECMLVDERTSHALITTPAMERADETDREEGGCLDECVNRRVSRGGQGKRRDGRWPREKHQSRRVLGGAFGMLCPIHADITPSPCTA